MIIYTDGIFDLFHRGHIEFLNSIKSKYPSSFLIVGIINDKDASEYKRLPIYNEKDRYFIIENLKCVDRIIKNAPLIINEKFMEKNKIDLVVHGFSNINDLDHQKNFFKIPIKLHKFEQLKYYDKISTTKIIDIIKNNY